ncbi:MAG: PD-(D/E)XK nuclease family protein [Acholeplasmatales bacterium]|nr:PD-(D/E)XK nuclease family protein [Acholeplasmatales bacterium]
MKNIAVKELAYFSSSEGDLSLSHYDEKKGVECHQYLQNKYPIGSFKEYYIKCNVSYLNEDYILHGFIDGLIKEDNGYIINEIKSTQEELDTIEKEYSSHKAQLMIYGYLYGLENNLNKVHLRLTYISTIDNETKDFDYLMDIEALEDYTFKELEGYIKFLSLMENNDKERKETIDKIKFPFEKERKGQRDMMKACFKALKDEEILYIIAPTGIGKTMASIFSSLKTLNEKDKLFYLTAKTAGKSAPIEAVKILKNKGLKMKTIDITSKKKACNMKVGHCDPDNCPYAKGYFDRLKDTLLDIYTNEDIFSREIISKYTEKHKICSFEFSLYLSYYCDLIICDYNYVFDPHAHLQRYFEDDTYQPKILCDEAHNLVSRSREMYSSQLSYLDIITLRAKLNGIKPSIRKECNNVLDIFDKYREIIKEKALYVDESLDMIFVDSVKALYLKLDDILKDSKNKHIKDRDEIFESFYKILDFINVSDYFSEAHRMFVKQEDENIIISIFCLDASKFILDTIKETIHGIVFFSATLYPINYYTNLLTKGEGKYLELESPFDPNKLDIIINDKISTRYKDRTSSLDMIIDTIDRIVKRKGNYIIFFPSYAYMKMVLDLISEDDSYEKIIQEPYMPLDKQEEVLNRFNDTSNTKVGFFVMGGMFSEGIDLVGDMLSGVIIVGVGLPLICDENNILKDYYDNIYNDGFSYAYTYPGFSKVIQAVGRVIRGYDDYGFAILLDNRYSYDEYIKIMPPNWKRKEYVKNGYDLNKKLLSFFKEEK